jgi:hypothetical protein
MTNLEDFTLFPRGSEVPLVGRVETCPRCGRNGIEEHPECGRSHFVHLQLCELQSDGMRTDPVDRCELRN